MGWGKDKPTAFIETVKADISSRQREIAMDALALIVNGSVVDKGAYKSNHRVSINDPDFLFNEDDTGQQALPLGNMMIADAPVFSNIIIQNNIPYGVKLENGWSVKMAQGNYRPTFALISEKYK